MSDEGIVNCEERLSVIEDLIEPTFLRGMIQFLNYGDEEPPNYDFQYLGDYYMILGNESNAIVQELQIDYDDVCEKVLV